MNMKRKNEAYGELLEVAEHARDSAYAPYSGVSVGAALLCASGKVYTGANIENASYTPTVCAERTAIFKAVLDGERSFTAIAVAGGRMGEASRDGFYPCGVCRQVMAEFADPDLAIITTLGDGYECHTLSELLPASFTKDKL